MSILLSPFFIDTFFVVVVDHTGFRSKWGRFKVYILWFKLAQLTSTILISSNNVLPESNSKNREIIAAIFGAFIMLLFLLLACRELFVCL